MFEIDPDIRKAKTLRADFYTDPAYFELSKDKIFARSWQFLARADDIEGVTPFVILPGMLDEPVITVKTSEWISCLSNVCTHRPDWRGTLTSIYDRGRFHALVRGSYYGKFSSGQPGFCDLCRDNYGANTLFDPEISYSFSQVKLSIGARNLFNVYPDQPSSNTPTDPSDPNSDPVKLYNNNYGTFPWAAASPFGYNGRFLYSRAEVQLGW